MDRKYGLDEITTPDRAFNAEGATILAHAALNVQGYDLEGSRLSIQCKDDQVRLTLQAKRQGGDLEAVQLPGHADIEKAIASRRARGDIDLPLDEVFQDGRRSGKQVIEQQASNLGVPSAAFGLENIPDETNRAEEIADSIAHLAQIRVIPAKGTDSQFISLRVEDGKPLIDLVGVENSGHTNRTRILEKDTTSPEFLAIGEAIKACAHEGQGRTYNALRSNEEGFHVRSTAQPIIGDRESATPEMRQTAFKRLDAAKAAAMEVRPASKEIAQNLSASAERPSAVLAGGVAMNNALAATIYANRGYGG